MNKKDLLKLAKQHRIADVSGGKAEIIRGIQLAEGNFDCYASAAEGECDQGACRWRDDCLPESTQVRLGA
jgi:hypothetical protein